MRDYRDAKAMAQTLRDVLADRAVSLTHSESLELVARILGFRDWHVLSARIQSQAQPSIATAVPSISANRSLPVVPVKDIVLFPDFVTPIFIAREKTKRAIEQAISKDGCVLVLTQHRPTDEIVATDALYGVGVIAKVLDLTLLGDGSFRCILKNLERAVVSHFGDGDFLSAEIMSLKETRGQEPEAFRLQRSVLEKLEAYLNIDFSSSPVPYARLPSIHEPGMFADTVAPILSIAIDRRQDLLETGDVVARLEKILAIVATDREAA
jgi:ATP-dependent Lon protease